MELIQYLYYSGPYFVIVLFLKFLWSRRKTIKIVIFTIPRDFQLLSKLLIRALFAWVWRRVTNETIFKSLDKNAKKIPRQVCFYFENEKWTYAQVQAMSIQVANFFHGQGYRKGDVVGLAMTNRPEVICIWLGLSRLGVTTALINFNLREDSLEHCVTVANCKAVIFGSEMREAFQDSWNSREGMDKPHHAVVLYELDRYLDGLFPSSPKASVPLQDVGSQTLSSFTTFKINDFAACLRSVSVKPAGFQRWIERNPEDKANFMEPFLYIYTSGTTGMPKPAKVSHSRLIAQCSSRYFLGFINGDITYCPLPLYHTFALTGVIWALVYGIPLVIIPKFSASKFWSDVHYYKVTVCLYMGELCRFIVNQPPQPDLETNHKLRIMFGVGVKPEVWETFVKRFKVKRFVESYGSTEGNCTMVNVEGTKVGAIGYIPVCIQSFYSVTLIKVDEITGEILRDKDTGLAIPCEANEPGELVGKISNLLPTLRFDGYTSKEATEKKTARDVFRKGDRYFRSGDIMICDEYGYYYFKDRIGDTFRWKGENVSTAEVEGLILKLCDMRTTVVYGVKIPGMEGRAGMAAIVDTDVTLNLKRLSDGLEKGLPPYARPVFIRCIREHSEVDMTGTFKLQKFNLQREGFDIEVVSDPILVYNNNLRGYQKLEVETFKQIMQGSHRL